MPSLSSFKLPKSLQITLGLSGAMIVIVTTIIMSGIGFSNAKVGNYQLSAQNCFQSKKVYGPACKHFIQFGVSPKLYLSDENYRDSIDKKYRQAIARNVFVAPKVAQFTLDHAYKSHVQFSAALVEQLREVSKNEGNRER
jgi:hypothetical protein